MYFFYSPDKVPFTSPPPICCNIILFFIPSVIHLYLSVISAPLLRKKPTASCFLFPAPHFDSISSSILWKVPFFLQKRCPLCHHFLCPTSKEPFTSFPISWSLSLSFSLWWKVPLIFKIVPSMSSLVFDSAPHYHHHPFIFFWRGVPLNKNMLSACSELQIIHSIIPFGYFLFSSRAVALLAFHIPYPMYKLYRRHLLFFPPRWRFFSTTGFIC